MCASMWWTARSGRPCTKERAFAAESPTRSEPISPGLVVTAIASTSPDRIPAPRSASSRTGTIASRWERLATSGTTPWKGAWRATCDSTTEERIRVPSSTTAAAVSSQEDSIPRIRTKGPGSADPARAGGLPAEQREGRVELGVGRGLLLDAPEPASRLDLFPVPLGDLVALEVVAQSALGAIGDLDDDVGLDPAGAPRLVPLEGPAERGVVPGRRELDGAEVVVDGADRLDEALPERGLPEEDRGPVVLERAGEDLGSRGGRPVLEDDDRETLVADLVRLGVRHFPGVVRAAARLDDEPLPDEPVRDRDGRLQHAPRVEPQVEDEPLHPLAPQPLHRRV